MNPRRSFLMTAPVVSLLAWRARAADTPAPAPVTEQDPTAVSLGYVADAARADKARFKQFAAGQACANCSLFQGAAGAANGPCPIYAGKLVAAKGWCSAYVKKV